ncbi:MAG: shikimate kinase [Dehalococcoidia bacterium]|nr:shikimate kinase [Dehalococcoidia bacterium]
MPPERIFLVGLSGSGKSTVGRLVAESLGWGYTDIDRRIEDRTGREIPEIFAADGQRALPPTWNAKSSTTSSRAKPLSSRLAAAP